MDIYNEEVTFLIPIGYGYLMVFFFSITLDLYIMQEPSYLGKIIPSINMMHMVLTLIKTRLYKDSHFDIPTKFRYLTDITMLNLPMGSLMPLLVLIIHTHAFTYIPDQHWWKHTWRKCAERFIRMMTIPCLRFEVCYEEVAELQMCVCCIGWGLKLICVG